MTNNVCLQKCVSLVTIPYIIAQKFMLDSGIKYFPIALSQPVMIYFTPIALSPVMSLKHWFLIGSSDLPRFVPASREPAHCCWTLPQSPDPLGLAGDQVTVWNKPISRVNIEIYMLKPNISLLLKLLYLFPISQIAQFLVSHMDFPSPHGVVRSLCTRQTQEALEKHQSSNCMCVVMICCARLGAASGLFDTITPSIAGTSCWLL